LRLQLFEHGTGGPTLFADFWHAAALALALATLAGGARAQTLQPEQFTICGVPCESLVIPGGSFVTENGNFANHATLIATDERGDQLAVPFINGLPSGRAADGTLYGPTAYALQGRNIYIAVGEADRFHSTGPNFSRRLPAAPFSDVVLQLSLASDPENAGLFLLTPAELQHVLGGQRVTLTATFGTNTAEISRLAVLGSGIHPSGIAVLRNAPGEVFVTLSGSNRLVQVNAASGAVKTIAQFPATPESVRSFGVGQLLVTLFSDTANASSVWVVDPLTGQSQPFLTKLNGAVDAIARNKTGENAFLVLEHSGGPGGLGQVVGIDSNRTTRAVIATGLNDATSLSFDETIGRLYISSRGDGLIYSLTPP
jgi:hypothetical protein